LPAWAISAESFMSITRSKDELSIVCPEDSVPPEHRTGSRWACFKLEGPFSFSAVGILTSFIAPLAEAGIPIFAVSTYDTDYVLVKEEDAARATEALERAGHQSVR
ncbi:MAG TPA: ACT domain-containing protein, partial [Terriglobales bacterium]|nr:ACT domain-containing protein [Terriglobales bacterium]